MIDIGPKGLTLLVPQNRCECQGKFLKLIRNHIDAHVQAGLVRVLRIIHFGVAVALTASEMQVLEAIGGTDAQFPIKLIQRIFRRNTRARSEGFAPEGLSAYPLAVLAVLIEICSRWRISLNHRQVTAHPVFELNLGAQPKFGTRVGVEEEFWVDGPFPDAWDI